MFCICVCEFHLSACVCCPRSLPVCHLSPPDCSQSILGYLTQSWISYTWKMQSPSMWESVNFGKWAATFASLNSDWCHDAVTGEWQLRRAPIPETASHHKNGRKSTDQPCCSSAAAAGTGRTTWKANCALPLFYNHSLDSGVLSLRPQLESESLAGTSDFLQGLFGQKEMLCSVHAIRQKLSISVIYIEYPQ